jgi:hypothetical protein|tara:strand:+ start:5112 stop:5561 length:450 start_codon:yes stop_codon:yes gene_type:complete
MADDASVTVQATVLPDEIAKTISGSMTISPADANDKWYYKLTSVSNSSTDLMAGNFIDYTAVDDDTAPTAIATGDKVNFLFIKNTDSSNDVYIVLDAGTASTSAGDAIKIKAGHSFYANLPNTTVGDIHAISSSSTVTCVVAALLDDVA